MNTDDLTNELMQAFDGDPEHLQRLHDRLAAAARAEGILDLTYTTVDTPLGRLLVVATKQGLVKVAYACQDHDAVLTELANAISPRILHAPARLEIVVREIDEYFTGGRTTFDVPLDLRLSAGFRRDVLNHLGMIGYGTTTSYGALAAAAGSPRASRAVGTACATNPLPIVLPCHRVVRSDGTLGRYIGGDDAKKKLLTLEAGA